MILTGVALCDSGSHEIRGSFPSPCCHQSPPAKAGFPRGVPLRGQANHLCIIETDFPQGYVLMSSSVPALSDTNKGGNPVDKPETTVLVPVAPLIYYLRVSLEQVIQTLQPWVGFQQAADFAGYNSLGSSPLEFPEVSLCCTVNHFVNFQCRITEALRNPLRNTSICTSEGGNVRSYCA